MALNLAPGERVIYEGNPSWRSILDFYFKGAAATLVVCLLIWASGEVIGDGADWVLIVFAALIGGGISIVAGLIKRIATRYAITTNRLNIKRGIISREVQEARIERVQDVGYSQSVLQRLLQIGDVDFDTASDERDEFVFSGVADPQDVLEQVRAEMHRGNSGLGDRA